MVNCNTNIAPVCRELDFVATETEETLMTSGIHDTQEEVNVGNWWYESGYGFWELPGEFREISVCAVFLRGKLQRYYFDYLPATF